MELHDIVDALTAPPLEAGWREMLADWPDASPEERNDVLVWGMGLRDEFLAAAWDIGDPQTLDMVAAVRYIELKSHWIMLNTQINYANVFQGMTNMRLAYQASLISQILEALERLIDAQDVDRILEFLAEPVSPTTGSL